MDLPSHQGRLQDLSQWTGPSDGYQLTKSLTRRPCAANMRRSPQSGTRLQQIGSRRTKVLRFLIPQRKHQLRIKFNANGWMREFPVAGWILGEARMGSVFDANATAV